MPLALTSSAVSSADAAGADLVFALRRFENLLDDALAAGGDLTRAIVDARRERGLSATVGHGVVAAVGKAQSALTDARGDAVSAHRHLERVAMLLGVDPAMYGDTGKPPKEEPNGVHGADGVVTA